MTEIISSDKKTAEKYLLDPKGPEILEKEMVKRLKSDKKSEETAEEKNTRLEAENAKMREDLGIEENRRSNIDEGIVSKKGATKVDNKSPQKSAGVEEVLALVNKKGHKITKEEYDASVERRKGIKGADQYDDKED